MTAAVFFLALKIGGKWKQVKRQIWGRAFDGELYEFIKPGAFEANGSFRQVLSLKFKV
jgi:hypothetical protein